jgi:hypothetical protein
MKPLRDRSSGLAGALFFAMIGLGVLAIGVYAVIEIQPAFTGIVLLIASAFPAGLLFLISWSLATIALTGRRSAAVDNALSWIGRGNRPLRQKDASGGDTHLPEEDT